MKFPFVNSIFSLHGVFDRDFNIMWKNIYILINILKNHICAYLCFIMCIKKKTKKYIINIISIP